MVPRTDKLLSSKEQVFSAIKENKLDQLALLLEKKADLSAKNSMNFSPLNYAASIFQWDAVHKIMEHMEEQKASNLHYGYLILCALQDKKNNLAKSFIKKGATFEDGNTISNGYRALHTVIQEQNFGLVASLLEHKANPNVKTVNDKEKTPLDVALEEKQPAIIRLLLKAGADQSIKNAEKLTPIEQAAKQGLWDCVDVFLEFSKDNSFKKEYGYVLIFAIYAKKGQGLAEKLLSLGARLSTAYTVSNGFFALHAAIEKQDFGVIKSLLAYKANPNIKTTITAESAKEITPLELAIDIADQDKPHIIQLLLDAGASQTEKNKEGLTPIEYAAAKKRWKCVETLLKHPHCPSSNNGSVLLEAIAQGQNEVAELLIHKKAFIEEKTPYFDKRSGYSALHQAIDAENVPLVDLLLESKADPLLKSKIKPTTAFDLALKKGQTDIIHLLTDKIGSKQKQAEECFSSITSFQLAYIGVKKFIGEYKLTYKEAQPYVENAQYPHVLKLAFFTYFFNKNHAFFSTLFSQVKQEGYEILAETLIHLIGKLAERNQTLYQSAPTDVCMMLYHSVASSHTYNDIYLSSKELSHLILLKNRYEKKLYTSSDFTFTRSDKLFICKIAAINYSLKKISLDQYDPELIKNQLEYIFGEEIFAHAFFRKSTLLSGIKKINQSTLKPLSFVPKTVESVTAAPLRHMTSEPLLHETATPLRHMTAAPLLHETPTPSRHETAASPLLLIEQKPSLPPAFNPGLERFIAAPEAISKMYPEIDFEPTAIHQCPPQSAPSLLINVEQAVFSDSKVENSSLHSEVISDPENQASIPVQQNQNEQPLTSPSVLPSINIQQAFFSEKNDKKMESSSEKKKEKTKAVLLSRQVVTMV